MDNHIYNSDYGEVEVQPIKIDGEVVLVQLQEDFPPLGENGDESWIDAYRLKPIE